MIQPDPLVWLYAIDVPTTPPTKYRLTAYPEVVFFERDSLGAAVAYSPGSIGHDEVESDAEGSIPRVRLSAQNITREAIALLEAHDGLVGQSVRVMLVRLSEMPDGGPVKDERYDVLEWSATEKTATLVLGRAALAMKKFPDRQTGREHCVHDYGGPGCGYDATRAGSLQTCTKLLEGTNGCRAHGLDEAAALLPNRHPQRMLFFPGIPRTSGVGVS